MEPQEIRGRIEFAAPDQTGIDYWQQMIELCLHYTEIARLRAAEIEAAAGCETNADAEAA